MAIIDKNGALRNSKEDLEAFNAYCREKVQLMSEIFDGFGILEFTKLIPEVNRKHDLVVSFLAILELARLRFIEIIQLENFGPIQLRSVRSLREFDMGMLEQY